MIHIFLDVGQSTAPFASLERHRFLHVNLVDQFLVRLVRLLTLRELARLRGVLLLLEFEILLLDFLQIL